EVAGGLEPDRGAKWAIVDVLRQRAIAVDGMPLGPAQSIDNHLQTLQIAKIALMLEEALHAVLVLQLLLLELLDLLEVVFAFANAFFIGVEIFEKFPAFDEQLFPALLEVFKSGIEFIAARVHAFGWAWVAVDMAGEGHKLVRHRGVDPNQQHIGLR